MKKVVLYMRYSSDNQTEQSIEGQERVCTEFCKRNDYMIVGKYVDRAKSASKDTSKRVEFLKMIADSEKKQWDAVVVYKLDRFARQRYDSATYKYRLKRNGVSVISATENISDTPEGIILESVLEGMAEFYSKELSQKVSRGMRESALKHMSLGGPIPLGFKSVNKRWEIDEETAPIVREIFDRYANGETIASISESFNQRGLRTSKGKTYGRSSFHTILSNERYIGTYLYKGERFENVYPPIVDKAIFEEVQIRLKGNKQMPARSRTIPFLLTGKIFCGECGGTMVGDSGTSKSGKKHYYYSCNKRKHDKNCKKMSIRKEEIEELVFKSALNFLTDENIDLMADMAIKAIQEEYESNDNIKVLEKRISDDGKKIQNLLKTLETGLISEAVVNRLQQVEEDLKSAQSRLEEEKSNNVSLTKEHIVFFLKQFAEGNIEDEDFKRSIMEMVIYSITVKDTEDGKIKVDIAFNVSPKTVGISETVDVRLMQDMVEHRGITRTPNGNLVYRQTFYL